ncbi:MAG: type II toxin-antitoxin system HicB family antitoxin [Lachnospiraceae bacterium]
MTKFVYPAVISKEDKWYLVDFPDFESCYTDGESLEEALKMAEDALALALYRMEVNKIDKPEPSTLEDIKVKDGEIKTLVRCDTMEYRKKNNNKAVKKTLTIPEWLNEEATAMGINFSQVLQEALIKRVG